MNKHNNSNLLLEIEVKDFITKIQTSKARKPIYYEQKGKHVVPISKAKHIWPDGNKKFIWLLTKNKVLLCDIKTKEPILKNSRAVGTPKYLAIKGNNIYSGFGGYRSRVIIMEGIKNFFRPFVKDLKITEFPIYLHFTIHDELRMTSSSTGNQTQDLDNLFSCYIKGFQDLMKAEGVIPDDNLQYIRKSTYEFIETTGDRKFVIKAYKYIK